MHPIVSAVLSTIQHNEMLVPGDRVLAGVSGGADSVCLAIILKELAVDFAIAHVNHGLRGVESDGDEEFSKILSEQLSVPFFSETVCLATRAGNLEAEARAARKAFFARVSEECGYTKIAVAHTKDDRIETFLMNLLRGSGTEGLVSMSAVSGSTIRPLIGINRTTVEHYLVEHGRSWRTDQTNYDRRFARNRLRHDVIPALAADFNPRLTETLARTVEILEAEDAWMRESSRQWLAEHASATEGELALDATILARTPAALARRVLRLALRQSGSSLENVSFDHIEAARVLLEPGKSGKLVEIPGGLLVAREFNKLVVRRPRMPGPDYDYKLQIPGSVHIPELGKVFRAEIIDKEGNQNGPERVFVDAGAIGPYVRIRNWKPGDYYKPVGLPAGKLKRLFQRARIPRSQRTSWPVLVAGSTIIWVASFPVSREFAPAGHSQKIVAFEALPS